MQALAISSPFPQNKAYQNNITISENILHIY
jgi:hypothetical protein